MRQKASNLKVGNELCMIETVAPTERQWNKCMFDGARRKALHDGWNTKDKAHNVGNFKISGVHYEAIAIACELGTCLTLGLDPNNCGWVSYSPNRSEWQQPDILGFIEVRSVTQPDNPLKVSRKDVEADAVLVKAHVPGAYVAENGSLVTDGIVRIFGWQYAKVAWDEGYRGPGATRLYVDELRPMGELRGMLDEQ